MKKEYDFTKEKRGAVDPTPLSKTRITIRLDNDILAYFRQEAETMGGGNYQTMINDALHEVVNTRKEPLEATLFRVVREELQNFK